MTSPPIAEATERTRATRLKKGDLVLVQYDKIGMIMNGARVKVDQLCLSRTKAPKRAFWAVVKDLPRREGGSGLLAIVLDINGQPHSIEARTKGVGVGEWAVTRLLKLGGKAK
jgi:hypothetical protein